MAKFVALNTITNVGPQKDVPTIFYSFYGTQCSIPVWHATLVDTEGSYSEIKGGSRLVGDQGVFSEDTVVIYYERGQSHSYCVPAGTQWFRADACSAAVAGTLAFRYPGFDARVQTHQCGKKLSTMWASI